MRLEICNPTSTNINKTKIKQTGTFIAFLRCMASCRTYKKICLYASPRSSENISTSDRRMKLMPGSEPAVTNVAFLTYVTYMDLNTRSSEPTVLLLVMRSMHKKATTRTVSSPLPHSWIRRFSIGLEVFGKDTKKGHM